MKLAKVIPLQADLRPVTSDPSQYPPYCFQNFGKGRFHSVEQWSVIICCTNFNQVLGDHIQPTPIWYIYKTTLESKLLPATTLVLDIQRTFDSVALVLTIKFCAINCLPWVLQSTAWFHPYLSDIKQIVYKWCWIWSYSHYMRGASKQGILGPLLFLCYVNDMPNSVNCLMLQYADDSALIFSDKRSWENW